MDKQENETIESNIGFPSIYFSLFQGISEEPTSPENYSIHSSFYRMTPTIECRLFIDRESWQSMSY